MIVDSNGFIHQAKEFFVIENGRVVKQHPKRKRWKQPSPKPKKKKDLNGLFEAITSHEPSAFERRRPFREKFWSMVREDPFNENSKSPRRLTVLMYCWVKLGWRPSKNGKYIYKHNPLNPYTS